MSPGAPPPPWHGSMGLDWAPPGVDVALARAAWGKRLNCPPTSAVGRLFDAAAAFLGLVQHAHHEAEGPMAVEAIAAAAAAAHDASGDPVALPLLRRADGVWQADWAPLVPLLCDVAVSPGRRAAAFHASMARALVAQAVAVRRDHGDFAVGLAGGVFQNRRLSELSLQALQAAGFRAHLPITVPCNDAGLSFGQVVEAAASLAGAA